MVTKWLHTDRKKHGYTQTERKREVVLVPKFDHQLGADSTNITVIWEKWPSDGPFPLLCLSPK